MNKIIEVCDETQTDDVNISGYAHFRVDDKLSERIHLMNDILTKLNKMYKTILNDFDVHVVALDIDFDSGDLYYSVEGKDTCIACATWKILNDIALPCNEPL